jgi:spore coat polysaccharide biosynthesis protein SpsF
MELMNKVTLVILQARMSSSRLPGKVLLPINGEPMIYWQIQRILSSRLPLSLIVATSSDPSDDILVDFLLAKNISVHRGSLDDVLSRFSEIANSHQYDAIVRITGDCPLVMPELMDKMLITFYGIDVDYLSNTLTPTYPDGLDLEIFRNGVIERLNVLQLSEKDKEHVTLGVYTRPEDFSLRNYANDFDLSDQRWTVDYFEDFEFVKKVFSHFKGRESLFGFQEVLDYLAQNLKVNYGSRLIKRNEGL